MKNRNFLLQVIEDLKKEDKKSNWRGAITEWIKC